ncbi:MAG: hypothetical protein Q9210_002467, partial [Variospora velana]
MPDRGLPRYFKYRTKTFLVLRAILAPEMGVFHAFGQFQAARRFVKALNELRAQKVKEESRESRSLGIDDVDKLDDSAQLRKPFSLVYGFYVLMGGFAINASPLHDRLQTVLLTPNGVLHLAERGRFIHISDLEIEDKSKANVLAKFLVILQFLWTMAEVLSRKAMGLPISVLEVHTLVQAGCALIMYSLWFNKPLDVDEPTMVSYSDFEADIALMLVRNQSFGLQPLGNLFLPSEFEPALYADDTYRCWPGHYASEASFLVLDPSWNEVNPQSSSLSTSLVARTPSPVTEHEPIQQEIPTPEGFLNGQETTISTNNETAPIDGYEPHQYHPSQLLLSRSKPLQQRPIMTDTASVDRRRDKFHAIMAPITAARRKAERQHKSSRLTTFAAAYLNPPRCENVWAGLHSFPPLGIPTKLSVFTGDIGPGGLGPNAYSVGPWLATASGTKGQEQPSMVMEVPEHCRKQLPLQNISPSTVAYYCPLKISLSHKDVRRWQLAGAALRADPASIQAHASRGNRLIDLSGPSGSSTGVYFYEKVSWRNPWREAWSAVEAADHVERYSLFFQRIYRKMDEKGGLRWTPVAAFIVATSLLYASIHMVLWDYRFPTRAEQLLWRISASILLAMPTAYAICASFSTVYRWLVGFVEKVRRRRVQQHNNPGNGTHTTEADEGAPNCSANNTLNPVHERPNDPLTARTWLFITKAQLIELLACFITPVGVLCVFSRVFIIVESFLSLRHVPTGVYAGVGWS